MPSPPWCDPTQEHRYCGQAHRAGAQRFSEGGRLVGAATRWGRGRTLSDQGVQADGLDKGDAGRRKRSSG